MKTRHIFLAVYPKMAAFASFWIGCSWLAWSGSFREHLPALAGAMQNGGALFALLGAAMLGCILGWWRACRLLAVAALALGGALLDGFDPFAYAVAPVDNAPSLADPLPRSLLIGLMLLGGALLGIGRRGRLKTLPGALAALAAGAALYPLLAGRTPPGELLRVEGVYATLLVLAALAAGMLAFGTPRRVRDRAWNHWVIIAAGALLSVAGWRLLAAHELDTKVQRGDLLLRRTVHALHTSIGHRVAQMRRLAERWDAAGSPPPQNLFDREAISYIRDIPELELMAVLDADGRIRRLRSATPVAGLWLDRFLASDASKRALQHVLDSSHVHIGLPSAMGTGASRVFVATALHDMDGSRGMAIAVENYETMLANAVRDDPELSAIDVLFDGRLAVKRGRQQAGDVFVHDSFTVHDDLDIHVDAWYGGGESAKPISYLPFTVLAAGLLFTLLLAVSKYLGAVSQRRALQVRTTYSALRASMTAQDNLVRLKSRIMRFSRDILFTLDGEGRFVEVSDSAFDLIGYPHDALQGRGIHEFLQEKDVPRVRAALYALRTGGEPGWSLRCRLVRRDGGLVDVMWSAEWSPEEGIAFCIARDIGWVHQTEQQTILQRKVFSDIIEGLSLEQVMASVCELAHAAMPAASCAVRTVDRAGRTLQLKAAGDAARGFESAMGQAISLDAALPQALAARTRAAVQVGDLQARELSARQAAQDHGVGACRACPLLSGDSLLGVIAFYWSEPYEPTDAEVATLSNLGHLASIAIERLNDRRSLEESEQRYRSLYWFNPEAVCSFDLQGHFTSANAACLRLTGYTEAQLLGRHFRGMVVPADLARTEEQFARACAGKATRYAASCYDQDGQVRQLDITNTPIIVDGTIVGVFGIARDVTEETRMREVLREKERYLRKLIHDTRDAILVIDARGKVRYANPAAEALFGGPLSALDGLALALPPESGRLFEWSTADLRGEPLDVEASCADTEWEGEHVRLLSLRDIRQRKASEQQLHLMNRSLEACYNAVVIVDAVAPDQPVTYVNPAFTRITGYAREEVQGRNCRLLQGPDTSAEAVASMRMAVKRQQELDIVLRNVRKDGTAFWNHLYMAPVPDRNGETTHFIGILNDITQYKQIEEQLQYGATHDILTELPNRRLLQDYLARSCERARQGSRHLAVAFFDLDGFKLINDSMGHDFGDAVLVQVARRMCAQVRRGDMVARVGGDEFVVVLPDVDRWQAHAITAAIVENVARPYALDGMDIHITASAGVTLSDGQVKDAMQLVRESDLAMYRAKREGRNTWHEYTADLGRDIEDRLTLRNDLKRAIDNGGLELYYQPQLDGRTGRLVGVEALLRWRHPARGAVSPAHFIPLAEESGQIIPLSHWVVNQACQHAQTLGRLGWKDITVALNISPLHFQRLDFATALQDKLGQYQLAPGCLEIEITEGVLLDDADRAIETLRRLKEIGVGISIDDFGTGYSSLNYLKNLPIDKIKIDRSFVQEVISDRHDASIVKAIISIAHHLELKVVAEGVETEAQYAFLTRHDCDFFQGYLFARPMPFDALVQQLAQTGARQALPGADATPAAARE